MAKRIISDKALRNRAYKIALNTEYVGYQRGLASIVYTFFDKKTGSGAGIKKSKEGQSMRGLKKIFGHQI